MKMLPLGALRAGVFQPADLSRSPSLKEIVGFQTLSLLTFSKSDFAINPHTEV